MSLLADLPSRGFLKNVSDKILLLPESKISALQTDDASSQRTTPQVLVQDKTNILIRALLIRRQRQLPSTDAPKGERSPSVATAAKGGGHGGSGKGKKRAHEVQAAADQHSPSKRHQPGSSRSSVGDDGSAGLKNQSSAGSSSSGNVGGSAESSFAAGASGSAGPSGGCEGSPARTRDECPLTPSGLQALKVDVLREKCRQMGLLSTGKKEALIGRIMGRSPSGSASGASVSGGGGSPHEGQGVVKRR
mmetsp:Transcript_24679/g.60590  ORF Transcript_24679/g.60590 Transcript_24679/m.60590 type:complete len:248 (-) Transcript_24679:219-962(-)